MAIEGLDAERIADAAFDLMTLSSAWVPAAVAFTVVVALRLSPHSTPVPAAVVWAPSVLAGALLVRDSSDTGGAPVSGWMIAVTATAVLVVGVGIWVADQWGAPSRSLAHGGRTVHVAVAVIGVALCVPETVRVVIAVGPALLTVAAMWKGLVAPLSRPEVVVAISLLAWVGLIDGSYRPSAVVGSAACIAAVGLLAPTGSTDGKRSPAPSQLAIHAVFLVTVLVCSRVAGIAASTGYAVSVALISLVAGAITSWMIAWQRWLR